MNINTIATQATYDKKPKKTEAFEDLKVLIEQSDDKLARELTTLYSFFTPPTPKKKTAFDWVTLAKATKDVRHCLNFTFADDDYIVATDGHRMHLVSNVEQLSGFYDTNKVELDLQAKFPRYKHILIENPDYQQYSKLDVAIEHFDRDGKVENLIVITFPNDNIVKLNKVYFDQAINNQNENDILIAYENDTVQIKIDARIAIIKPIND